MSNEKVVEVGKLLGDATRVALLDAMFDGRAYTVTELSRHVGVAPSTASEHLGRMLDADLLSIEAQGKHRYYRLRDTQVAELLEKLFEFGHGRPVARASNVPAAMVYARSCYDHLAGTLAVALTQHLHETGAIADSGGGLAVTESGLARLSVVGVHRLDGPATRPVVRTCLDWSERKQHLAGSMPAQLLSYMLDERWFRRRSTTRGLELTDVGRRGLRDVLAFEAP